MTILSGMGDQHSPKPSTHRRLSSLEPNWDDRSRHNKTKSIPSARPLDQLTKYSQITRNARAEDILRKKEPSPLSLQAFDSRGNAVKLPNIYNFESLNFDFTDAKVPSPSIHKPTQHYLRDPSSYRKVSDDSAPPMTKVSRLGNYSPWEDNTLRNVVVMRRKKDSKTTLSSYQKFKESLRMETPVDATSIIVESFLLGEPDDMSLLPNGSRIDRSGFLL